MKVLVTGGAGYIGSACVEKLISEGHKVVTIDNLTEGHRSAVHPDADFIEADIADEVVLKDCFSMHQPDAIIHFAANALVGESMTNPGKYFNNNTTKAQKLLECAASAGIRKFIFSSTCATYGIPDKVPMNESTPQNPINPYGESKLMFEKILGWYQKIYNIEPVIFRYFNAAGATSLFGEHHRIETHLIPNVLFAALGRNQGCRIFGTDYETPDGTCVRDYIHITDLAQAHILALKPGISGAFNLGNGDGYSVRQVIDTCRQITGREIAVSAEGRRPGDPPTLVAAADKARNVLGWTPENGQLDAIIESAWKWHLNHPEGYPD